MSEYQLCPKCGGQGTVSKPPWVPGDQHEWSATQTSFICDVCHGEKIILRPGGAEYLPHNQGLDVL